MKEVLVGFSVPYSSGLQVLKRAVVQIQQFIEIKTISTCYAALSQGSYDRYVVATQGSCMINSSELLAELKLVEIKFQQRLQIFLLLVENEVRMDPELTLPHPVLIQDVALLQTSVETWGQFYHPILKKTLIDAKNEDTSEQEIDFVLSGRDFFRSIVRRY